MVCTQCIEATKPLYFIYSAPKTGTHLLNKAVGMIIGHQAVMNAKNNQRVEKR